MKNKRIRNAMLINLGFLTAALFLALLVKLGISLPCIFYQITGLQCPGCGNTRAAMALLRLDFAAAFEYNLLFPIEFGYIAYMYLSALVHYIRTGKFSYQAPYYYYIDIPVLVIVVAWGIVRNFL